MSLVDRIAENIRWFADQRQMGLSKLADTAGVARTTLYRLLNGQRANPSIETIEALATALEVSALALLGATRDAAVTVARDSYIQPTVTTVPYNAALVQAQTIEDDGAAQIVIGVGSRQATMPTLTRAQRDALVGVLLSATRFPEDTPRCVREMF